GCAYPPVYVGLCVHECVIKAGTEIRPLHTVQNLGASKIHMETMGNCALSFCLLLLLALNTGAQNNTTSVPAITTASAPASTAQIVRTVVTAGNRQTTAKASPSTGGAATLWGSFTLLLGPLFYALFLSLQP
ncbi:hypothetical protein AAFF_G00196750, partial [Aldrovandia affinis]